MLEKMGPRGGSRVASVRSMSRALGTLGAGRWTVFGPLAGIVLGCSNGDSGSGSGSADIRCTGSNQTFPTFDKTCTSEANCVLVHHTTSCCGSQLIMAINQSEQARFRSAESICDQQYPACGCASQGPTAEDGTLIPFGSENLVKAACDNGICKSHYGGKTFPCGTATCSDMQYCSSTTGGPAGSPTSSDCVSLGGCTTCSCIGRTGCNCSENQGLITVSCAAP